MKEYRLYVYKTDSTIVDVTNECTSFKFDAGSVMETGDLFPDNPVKTMQCSLVNTNNKQYSPHYNKGKVKYINTTLNLQSGVYLYDLPFENTLMIYDKSNKYFLNIMQGKIRVGSINSVSTESIPVKIAYLDIDEMNPINYIQANEEQEYFDIGEIGYFEFGNQLYYQSQFEQVFAFSPLIQEGNRVSLYEDTVSYSFSTYAYNGNGTNQLLIKNSKTAFKVNMLNCRKYNDLKLYFDFGSLGYYELGNEEYFKIASNGFGYSNINITGFTQVGNDITITLDRNLLEEETLFFTVTYKEISSYLKFDGYIVDVVNSDLETVSFGCKDRAYDLQNVKIDYTDIRNFDSKALTSNTFETLSETISATINSNSCTTTYNNYTSLFTLNEKIRLYNGTDYIKAVISAITSTSMTFVGYKDDEVTVITIPNGIYTIYKVYNPSINPYYFEYFMQDLLNDTGLPYNVVLGSRNLFAYLPKAEDSQYIDLWSLFQDICIKTGNIVSFENINGNFELFYRKIPLEFGTSKYTITDKNILDSTSFSLDSTGIRTSYFLKYYKWENSKRVVASLIKDDFIKSTYTCVIPNERNLLLTDETIAVGKKIRVNNEYLEIKSIVSSGVYKLNKNAKTSGTYDLYLQGIYTDKYGLKIATYELDNTSAIDTEEKASNFLNYLIYQTREPIATYKLVLNLDEYTLENFDTITVNSAKLSLWNEKMFVQSVAFDNNGGQKILYITLNKIMQVGKYKYKEMITERGLNVVTTGNKQTTTEVLPPPQNLVAFPPAIDDLQNYVVYSTVSWNDYIGRNVSNWEIQYSTDDFNTFETRFTNETTEKIILKEQKLYKIRVRAKGKEGFNGEWSNTTVDASIYLIDNPIQNRTWYIRMFIGNDEVEYFNRFDLLGYTNQYLIDNIDTIEIVPNADKGIKTENYILWKKSYFNPYPTIVEDGLEFKIKEKLGNSPNKNLFFNVVPNGYYKLEGTLIDTGGAYGSLRTDLFKNITGINNNVIFRNFNNPRGFENRNANFGDVREIKNLTILQDKNDTIFSPTVFYALFEYYANYNDSRIMYKNINIEIKNFTNQYIVNAISCNKVQDSIVNFINCNLETTYGIKNSSICKNNKVYNAYIGFTQCYLMNTNKAINCSNKYVSCYSSEIGNETYLIPNTGGDSPTFGWNT